MDKKSLVLEIIDIGHKGESIAKYEGLTVFVEGGAIIGDIVEAQVTKSKKNYLVAELKKIIKCSPVRIESICEKSDNCGGCQLIHMNYSEQLKLKMNIVDNTLKRIGKLKDYELLDIIGMENNYYYRNKAQYPIGTNNNKVVMGFYEKRSHNIIDINKCYIQDKNSETIIKIFKEFYQSRIQDIYNEIEKTGNVRRIITKYGFSTNQLMIVIVTKNKKLNDKEELIAQIVKEVPSVTTIVQNINPSENNNVMGYENVVLYGDGTIIDMLEDVKFEISPNSFFQVNPVQTVKMYNKVLEFGNIDKNSTVIDLYCGLGSISLFVARYAKQVYGVEIVEDAIRDAKRNAIINNLQEKTDFYCGKSEDLLPKLKNKGIKADLIILDPPRKGCEESVLDTIAQMDIKKIVYVSCNPSTFARDVNYLNTKYGYELKKVQPIDNFCNTMHIECVSLIER